MIELHVLHPDPKTCALILYDRSPKRARAQLIEGLQMLAANAAMVPPIKMNGEYYSDYWKRHPITKWVIARPDNFWWTVDFLYYLGLHQPGHAGTSSIKDWLDTNGFVRWDERHSGMNYHACRLFPWERSAHWLLRVIL